MLEIPSAEVSFEVKKVRRKSTILVYFLVGFLLRILSHSIGLVQWTALLVCEIYWLKCGMENSILKASLLCLCRNVIVYCFCLVQTSSRHKMAVNICIFSVLRFFNKRQKKIF